MLCFQKFPVANKFMDKKGGVSRFSVEFFFVSQCRKTLQGNPSVLCFRKFPVANKFMDKKGGVSRLSVEFLFVSQCRKTSQGNPLGCHYFWISETFTLRRVIPRILVEKFLNHNTETFRRGTFP